MRPWSSTSWSRPSPASRSDPTSGPRSWSTRAGLFWWVAPHDTPELTGRKTAIDTYGEYARHSGAALSGKDPTRIDRVGAYAARWAAKNVVAAGLADECEVHLSYMIGRAQPVSLQVDTFGTGRLDDAALAARVAHTFDFRLAAIIAAFDLRHRSTATGGGFFEQLAAYGHVGRDDLEPALGERRSRRGSPRLTHGLTSGRRLGPPAARLAGGHSRLFSARR